MQNLYYGIADCHGIESFLKEDFNVLCEKPATMLSKDALKIDKLSKKKKNYVKN